MDNRTEIAYRELASAQMILLRALIEVARNAPQSLLMLDWSKKDVESLAKLDSECLHHISSIQSPLFNIHNKRVFFEEVVPNYDSGQINLAEFALRNSFYRKAKII